TILVLPRWDKAQGKGDARHARDPGMDRPYVLHVHAAQAAPVEEARQCRGADLQQRLARHWLQFAHLDLPPPGVYGAQGRTAMKSACTRARLSAGRCWVCLAGREAGSGNIFTHSVLSAARCLAGSFTQNVILMMSSRLPPAASMSCRM